MLALILHMAIVALITFFAIKLFIHFAPQLKLVDIPNHRSSHVTPTPRGAGIIFGFIFLVYYISLNFDYIQHHYLTILAMVFVFGVGLIDDLLDIKSKTKFFVLVVASTLVYFDGFVIDNLGTYFGYTIPLGYLALPFTVFALTGFTNSLNLIDGKDGLAASVAIAILLVFLYIGFLYKDMLIFSSAMCLITVLGTFLVFNWNPAKVFMGDSGSLFVGFMISLLSVQSLQYIEVTTILILAGLPLLDTMVVMMRRKQRGISLLAADKNHIHHILYAMKLDVKFTVIFLTRIQIAFSLIAIQIISGSEIFNLLLFINLFLIFFAIFDPRFKARDKKKNIPNNLLRARYNRRYSN